MLGPGWMKALPGFHPAGRLWRSSFVPDETVKATHSHQLIVVIVSIAKQSLISMTTDPKLI